MRICLTCGHVGCSDISKNKHATKHYEVPGHPLIQSFKRHENWKYYYIDELVHRPEMRGLSGLEGPGPLTDCETEGN